MPSAFEAAFLKFVEKARLSLAAELLRCNRGGELRKGDRLNKAVRRILLLVLFRRMGEERGIDAGSEFDLFDEKLGVGDEWLAGFASGSPISWREVPIEMLGTVYERSLGSIVRARGRSVLVEENPEMRKGGGVFYTPRYIVEYIVRQTVEKRLRGISPANALKLRFLDPACGSGIFLMGVFERACEYWQRRLAGGKKLSFSQKRQILLANMFGVDLDPGAVEVTKLSLYLKLLEGESRETLKQYREQFPNESLLPGLGGNIKCGNALVESDFAWSANFRRIMSDGGFDAVVGNPPYVRIQTLRKTDAKSATYLSANYASARRGNYDIYVCFVERALGLLNKSGKLGFVLPHKFVNSEYGRPLREIISVGRHLAEFVHFGANQIFESATTYTCLMFLGREVQKSFRFVQVDDLKAWRVNFVAPEARFGAGRISEEPWSFHLGPGAKLIERLKSYMPRLGDVSDIFVGLQTSADDVFVLKFVEKRGSLLLLESKSLGRVVTLESEFLRPLVSGADVHGYDSFDGRQFILFPYSVVDERATLVTYAEIARRAPRTAKYLRANRERLACREGGKFADGQWHRFGRSQNLGIQGRKKVCVPRLVDRLCAALDVTGENFLDNVDVGGVTFRAEFARHDLHYLTGLLNSKLLVWFFPHVSAPFRGGWLSANRQFLSRLPFRVIDFANQVDKALHDRLMRLVEKRMEQQKSKSASEATDQKIDLLVYELYGLTTEEVEIIEKTD